MQFFARLQPDAQRRQHIIRPVGVLAFVITSDSGESESGKQFLKTGKSFGLLYEVVCVLTFAPFL